jgi:hypothetical protein
MFANRKRGSSAAGQSIPNGFVPSKAQVKRIEDYVSIPELLDLIQSNAHLLASTNSPAIRTRLEARKEELERRIDQLRVKDMENGLRAIHIEPTVEPSNSNSNSNSSSNPNSNDVQVYGQDQPRPVAAKQRVLVMEKEALQNNVPSSSIKSPSRTVMFDHQEACKLQQEEEEQRMQRRRYLDEIAEEREREMAFLASRHSHSTISERERHARILAFMNARPDESDEDDDDEMEDEDRIDGDGEWETRSTDSDDDAVMGDDFIEPGELSHIIRVPHDKGWPGPST